MPTLPDLQTTLISTLAYYDVGVTIKKSDILPLLESFTEYDNGIDGVLSFAFGGGARTSTGTRLSIRVRVRTDGLLYAWGLRADEDAAGTQFDNVTVAGAKPFVRALLPVCPLSDGAPDAGDTTLYRAILELANGVTTAGKIAPTTGTVSYYDFQFTSTGNIYVVGDDAFASGTAATNLDPWQFTQPAGVTIYVLAAQVGARFLENGGSNQTARATLRLNGTTLIQRTSNATLSVACWSSRQGGAIAAVLQPEGTQNNAEIEAFCDGSNNARSRTNGVLVIYASS